MPANFVSNRNFRNDRVRLIYSFFLLVSVCDSIGIYCSFLFIDVLVAIRHFPSPYVFPMAIDPFTVTFNVPAHQGVSISAVYTNLSASADDWIDKVEPARATPKEKVVGTDIEFTPRGRRQKAVVLQLCVGQECLVYHICQADEGVSEKFKRFLRNRRYKFAGVDTTADRRMINHSEHILLIDNHIDIQGIWRNPDLVKRGKQGMKDLAAAS